MYMYVSCETKSGITPQTKKDTALKCWLRVFHTNTSHAALKSQFWKECLSCFFSHDEAQIETIHYYVPCEPKYLLEPVGHHGIQN